jgi:hypothetical protein
MSADEETVAELKARVEQLEEKVGSPAVSRRDVLAGAGVGGLAALLGVSGSASAGSGQAGTLGGASAPVDVQAEDIYLNDATVSPSQNGQIARNGSTIEFYTDGQVKRASDIGSGGGSGSPTTTLGSDTDATQAAMLDMVQSNNIHFAPSAGVALDKGQVVLSPSSSGWDSGLVEEPFIFWSETEQRYEMLYMGFDGSDTTATTGNPQIGHAYSYDGLAWTKNSSNPVFTPSSSGWDSENVSGPFCWFDDSTSTVYLFYFGSDSTGYENGTKQLGVATTSYSNFPTGWTRDASNPIISPSGSAWRAQQIWKACVVQRGGTYHMFVNATAADGLEKIGHATSTNLTDWSVDDANSPVLDVGAGGSWDDEHVGNAWIVRRGNYWLMYYYGFGGGTSSRNGLAYTTDASFPYGWQRHGANPILDVGSSGDFDEKNAHKPVVINGESGVYHYYTAEDSSSLRQIAVAVGRNPFRIVDGSSGTTWPTNRVSVIEDFNTGSLDTGYNGDTSYFTVQSSTLHEGAGTLRADASSTSTNRIIVHDTDSFSKGDTVRFTYETAANKKTVALLWACQSTSTSTTRYQADIDANAGTIRLQYYDGSFNTTQSTSVSIPQNEIIEGEVTWNTDDSQVFTLYTQSGQLASISGAPSSALSGGTIGWLQSQGENVQAFLDYLGTV